MKKINRTWIVAFVTAFIMSSLVACGDSETSEALSNLSDTVESAVNQAAEDIQTADSDVKNETDGEATEEEKKEDKEEKDPYDDFDRATQNAVKSARNYLSFTAFSKKGLIKQLSSEYGDGYTEEQAKTAVQYLEDQKEVKWKEQAVKAAENYLSFTSFSRQGLIDQLTSEYGDQFTKRQAEYAADKVGL